MLMPISMKIREKINNLDDPADFKQLLLDILVQEDKGSYRFADDYERIVGKYLSARDGDDHDQNN